MKRHVILAGAAGAVLAAASVSGALAQARSTYYPDGTNCSLLSDAELVACQNQIYARQLQTGISAQATGPNDQTVIPTSNPAATAAAAPDIVPGAEVGPLPGGLVYPEDVTTGAAPSTVVIIQQPMLPGPEGTVSGGGYAVPE